MPACLSHTSRDQTYSAGEQEHDRSNGPQRLSLRSVCELSVVFFPPPGGPEPGTFRPPGSFEKLREATKPAPRSAPAAGVFISVIARPNGAAIIREERNFRKARRLMPHRFRRSSMVSRTLEEPARGARTMSPPMLFRIRFWESESQPYITSVTVSVRYISGSLVRFDVVPVQTAGGPAQDCAAG